MSSHPITQEGYDQLVEDYDRLKKVELPNVIRAIADARAHGDLKENAEYHAARERQSYVLTQISSIGDRIARSHIVKIDTSTTTVIIFGCKVRVRDLSDDSEEEYVLVGSSEADPGNNKISIASPIGKGLLGSKPGDVVEIETPRSMVKLKILSFT
jgi:transcription elongation factor GreA